MSDDKTVIHIDAAEKRDDLPEYDQDARCPQCGGMTECGFGLAGGGYGIYSFCPACEIVTNKSAVSD